jgi:Protein of unknown function (DUF2752)
MMALHTKPGFVAIVVGVTLLAELALARALFSADHDSVAFAGIPIDVACAFKQHFGIPCPGCGMTRSLILSLHGNVTDAADLNPAGPVAIAGLFYFSAAMLWLGFRQRRLLRFHESGDLARTERRIRWATAIAGMILIATAAGHWLMNLGLINLGFGNLAARWIHSGSVH